MTLSDDTTVNAQARTEKKNWKEKLQRTVKTGNSGDWSWVGYTQTRPQLGSRLLLSGNVCSCLAVNCLDSDTGNTDANATTVTGQFRVQVDDA